MEQEEYDYLTAVIYTLKNRLAETKSLIQEISSRQDNWNYEPNNIDIIRNMQTIVREHKCTSKDLKNTISIFNATLKEFEKKHYERKLQN